jgi:hypothetical protein
MRSQLHRQPAPGGAHELVDLVGDDLLDVAIAGEGLAHARGVHIELHRRALAGQHVALEVGRDVQHEGVVAPVQPGSMSGSAISCGVRELRRVEGRDDARRQRRPSSSTMAMAALCRLSGMAVAAT